jgi:hypothetical protein
MVFEFNIWSGLAGQGQLDALTANRSGAGYAAS